MQYITLNTPAQADETSQTCQPVRSNLCLGCRFL